MPEERVSRGQRRALGVLAIAAFLAFCWIAMPVGMGLFLGCLLAFTIEPLYHRLSVKLGRPTLAAVMCSVGCTLTIAGTIIALGYALASQSAAVVDYVSDATQSGFGPITRLMRRAHFDPGDLGARIREGAANALGRAASAIATIASVGVQALLTLLFIALSTFFVLLHWRSLTIRVERMLPLHPMHTRRLFREARNAGRGILLGTLATGLAQGALAALGYRLFGIEHALLLGAITAVASLVPAVGTLLVWGPIVVYSVVSGRLGAGIGLLVYCALAVIGVCDFVLRPLLVGRAEKGVPSLITFIAIFGGIEVFGVVGLVLGPVLVSLCLAVLRTWEGVTQAEETVVSISRSSAPPRPSRPSWTEERISH